MTIPPPPTVRGGKVTHADRQFGRERRLQVGRTAPRGGSVADHFGGVYGHRPFYWWRERTRPFTHRVAYRGKEMWRRNLSLWALVGRWWPVPVVLCSSLLIQKVFFESRYDVAGHAAEHLSSASTFFFACAVVIILLWATPSALRQPDVLVACAAWLAATALVLVGNVRVVNALVDAGLGQTPTGRIRPQPTLKPRTTWQIWRPGSRSSRRWA